MTPWEFDTDQLIWRFSVLGADRPVDLPDHWTDAFRAVGRDLKYRRHGREITLDHVDWEVRLNNEYWVCIGMVSAPDADIGGFSMGQGYRFDTTPAQASVWVAEAVQDDLSGYEFVQWPSDGWRLLEPRIQNDEAVWVDCFANETVARIGSLGPGSS